MSHCTQRQGSTSISLRGDEILIAKTNGRLLFDTSKAMFTLGARARLSLGTRVDTPFLKDPPQKVETLYSGTEVGACILGTRCLNTAPFCPGAQALVLGRQVRTWPHVQV